MGAKTLQSGTNGQSGGALKLLNLRTHFLKGFYSSSEHNSNQLTQHWKTKYPNQK